LLECFHSRLISRGSCKLNKYNNSNSSSMYVNAITATSSKCRQLTLSNQQFHSSCIQQHLVRLHHQQQQPPLHLQHGPSVAVCLSGPSAMLGVLQTPAGYGSSQQQLLLPQLYQLQCPAPTVMQSQYCAADSSTVGEQTLTFASHVASSGNNWQNAMWVQQMQQWQFFLRLQLSTARHRGLMSVCCHPSNLAGAATTAVTTISPGASVWRMRSPNGIVQCPSVSNVFSESSSPFMRPACATVSQSGMYVVGQQPGTLISMMGLQFAGVSGGNSDIPRADCLLG
jgi:hypothetical protein